MTRRKRALDGLDRDIRDHIERETQDNLDRGMAPEEARRQALLKFGNVALAKEDTRSVWGWRWLDQVVQDGRYAVRVDRGDDEHQRGARDSRESGHPHVGDEAADDP